MAERLVVDASVAAKWFLDDEDDVDLATMILASALAEEIDLYAPKVFTYEVCALLSRAYATREKGSPRIESRAVLEAASDLLDVPIQYQEPVEEHLVEALKLSMQFSKTVKDMTYLYLAKKLDCSWCTADKKLLVSPSEDFPTDRILLLSTLRNNPKSQITD